MKDFIEEKIGKIDQALAKAEVQLYTDKDVQKMLGELDKVAFEVEAMQWFLRAELKRKKEDK
ncbi:hypothetical protein BELINDA_231 [Bacillus phage Belinda]|uniref:hypothetical protein n=1 Tax=Bacillus phage Belinda TaxID=1852564 RepID=UPI0007F0B411|nr:hypothetical protein BI039_gp147 [Bacillus phage Belinda]ANM46157.1 hypothetical protein BELINDA_231 [Bacillus phage Belinda]